MKRIFSKLTLFGLILSIFIGSISQSTAATSQWFPTVGTTVEYELTAYIKLDNGTLRETNQFLLFDYGAYLAIYPIVYDEIAIRPSWTSLENDTTIKIIHTYKEKSSTELYRNTTIKSINNIYGAETVMLVTWRNNTHYTPSYMNNNNELTLQKSNFFTSMSSDFVDHIDNTLGVHESYLTFDVRAITTNGRIMGDDGDYTINTYYTDNNGQVISYSRAITNTWFPVYGDMISSCFTFERPVSNSISGIPIQLTITVLAITIGMFIIVLNKKNFKIIKSKK